jgi:PH domain
MKRSTLYIYEKDNYDKPFQILSLESVTLIKHPEKSYQGKEWLIEIKKSHNDVICLACDSQEVKTKWIKNLEKYAKISNI